LKTALQSNIWESIVHHKADL